MFNELLKNVMSLGIITDDDVKRLTAIELMMLIIERTNGLLNHVENIDEELHNLSENIRNITIEQLNNWTQDGTFDVLINESALKTVNDRIDETNNQLSASVSYVTPEMFGAIGDGESDDTEAINRAIDTNKKVIFGKDYKFTKIILKNSIEAYGVLNGNIIIDRSNINVDFNSINGSISLIAENEIVQQCFVRGNKIVNNGDCIILQDKGGMGVQYNSIEVGLLKSVNGSGIKLDCIRGWVNNNYVRNTTFTGNCGISSLNQLGPYDGMIFDNDGFEHIKKWFDLKKCINFIFKNFRMMPFEAFYDDICGDLTDSRVVFENSITGVYFKSINCNNSVMECYMPYSPEGERIADKLLVVNDEVVSVSRDSRPQFFKKVSEMSSTTTVTYSDNYTAPIYIICDDDKYVWLNFQIPLVLSALKYIKLYIVGTPQQNIEVAIDNKLKLTISPTVYKEEYTIFLD